MFVTKKILFLNALITTISAFAPHNHGTRQQTNNVPILIPRKYYHTRKFLVGTALEPEDDNLTKNNGSISKSNNPSTTFGKPLNDATKEFNRKTVAVLKEVLFDTLFAGEGRHYARFYALETIARVPYFAYLSTLHLYETLGMWRKANYLRIHFAESWNELHHLLIMEELGGSEIWADRFVAQHISVGYYCIVCLMYMFNPTLAYNINEFVEEHAALTYDQFLKENEETLRSQPAPSVAKEYYRDGDLYMFDEFQTGTCEPRRPKCDTLYDTFVNIRDDELQHVNTMIHLQADIELNTVHDDVCDVPTEFLEGV